MTVNPGGIAADSKNTKQLVWLDKGLFDEVAASANVRDANVSAMVQRIVREWLDPHMPLGSVQQGWARPLPIQQQSVLLLATRGPDGMRKDHPAKELIRAYRATVMNAASTGRPLLPQDDGDGFMRLHALRNSGNWHFAMRAYFDHVDEVPHHYHLHLLHGAQIIGVHYPGDVIKRSWWEFYERGCDDMHLIPESVGEMNARLNDFGRSPGGEQGIPA